MSTTADLALKNLERLISRDPLLRDIIQPMLPTAKRRARCMPPVDVIENEDGWLLRMEIPGTPRTSIAVRLDGSRLTVSGDKTALRSGSARIAEREVGPFSREFLLPFQVQPNAIRATLELGVLTVALPRTDKTQAREVHIEVTPPGEDQPGDDRT